MRNIVGEIEFSSLLSLLLNNCLLLRYVFVLDTVYTASGVARIFQRGGPKGGVDNQVGGGDKWGGAMKKILKIQIEMVAFLFLVNQGGGFNPQNPPPLATPLYTRIIFTA